MNIEVIISFKLDEFRFAKRTGNLIKFIFSNISNEKRRTFYEMYVRKGLDMAISMGIKIPLDFPIETLDEIFYEKIYDVEGFVPQGSDSVIDVGAHTGDWTIYCAKVLNVKEIYAFEPLKKNVQYTNSILKLNGCLNSHVYDIALSDCEREIEMEYTGAMLGDIRPDLLKKIETIKFRTLDSFKLKCDILKIDVEGFEFEVLKGSIGTIRQYKPKLILETHTKKLRSQCHELLESEGYKLEFTGRKAKLHNMESNFDEIVNLFYAFEPTPNNA